MRKHRIAKFGMHIPIHITNIYAKIRSMALDRYSQRIFQKKIVTEKVPIRHKNEIQR